MAVTIDDRLDEIEEALLLSPAVTEFAIIRRWVQSDAGYIRLRVVLTNGDLLESAEYLVLREGRIVLEDYRHHWMMSDQRLRRRWDCTPHHPGVDAFPHHCHVGDEGRIEPSAPMSIAEVLDLIKIEIASE